MRSVYNIVEPCGEILHDGKKSSEVRLFSQQLSLAIIYVYPECVPQCLSTYECVCVFQSVWVRAQRGRSLVCLEWVPSVSWNVALPPMLRWLPSSKMAARITPSQWETEKSERFCMRREGKKKLSFISVLFSFFLFLSFFLALVCLAPLSVDKQCFVGSETGLLLFLLGNLWLSVAARQVLLAGVCVLCYHLQPADKHLL